MLGPHFIPPPLSMKISTTSAFMSHEQDISLRELGCWEVAVAPIPNLHPCKTETGLPSSGRVQGSGLGFRNTSPNLRYFASELLVFFLE